MANKDIVIIGAGYAGVSAAKKLAKKFKKDDSVSITLIDRHSYHTMMTELHEVATHRVEPDAIQFDLGRLFNRTKVNLVTDNVTHVDHDSKTVQTENGKYQYDYLILGMGAEPNDFKTPGVKEHAFTLWSMEDALKLRKQIENIVAKAAIEHDQEKRRAMLTFVVCGSGFTGIELVGELVEWKERLAKNNKIDPDEITLYVVEAATTILNLLNEKEANKAEAYLTKKGVKILKDSPIVEVREHEVVIMDKQTIPTYTLAWTAGIKANSDTEEYGMEKAHARRLKVNQYMQSDEYEGVYVVGDLAYYEEKSGKPNPQIVEGAEQTGTTAAKNIIAEITNTEKTAFEGKYHGIMVSIGARYGVANLMGIHLSGWFANFVKHLVNLFYLFTINSGYYMFKYVQHEFFQTRDKRNIFRDLLTRYGNVLWSLPLRIFVGGFWLVEGGSKLWGQEIWQKATSSIGNLPLLFKGIGEDSWLVSSTVNMDFPWLQDPTSGATETATEWAEPILSKMPGWFAWIMEIMMPNVEIALFMQKMMVFIEIAIGLAIIFGLFTWLANAASIGFLTMFTLTAMLGWDKIWALPASIALMNGSGRTFGLDYWVIPFIQNKVGNFWYGKERSIYRDK